jgi:hypothetical protein
VDLNPEHGCNERIYLNSNMDYFRNFKFDKFESDLVRSKFKNIEIVPSTQFHVQNTGG